MPRPCLATLTAIDDPADTRLACVAVRHNLSPKLEQVRAVVTRGIMRALLASSLLQRMETNSGGGTRHPGRRGGGERSGEVGDGPRALVKAMAWYKSAVIFLMIVVG